MEPVARKPLQAQRNKAQPGLRARALAMLARREHSRLELERKLALYAEHPDEIAGLLDDFERRGWISERRLIEQVTASRRRRFGARHIADELRGKGIAEATISELLSTLEDTELESARMVWRKKFGTPPHNVSERARQARFLQGRGFTLATALRIIKEAQDGTE